MNIRYLETSFIPHFSEREMDSMRRMLRLDLPTFEFDEEYSQHIQRFHGKKPIDRFFKTMAGKCLPIDRFLNYGNLDLLDERWKKDLNGNVILAMISDRLNIYLLPFAAMANGDFLCFDYEKGLPPSVVLWVQELSEEDEPHTEPVADTFNAFLSDLTENFRD